LLYPLVFIILWLQFAQNMWFCVWYILFRSLLMVHLLGGLSKIILSQALGVRVWDMWREFKVILRGKRIVFELIFTDEFSLLGRIGTCYSLGFSFLIFNFPSRKTDFRGWIRAFFFFFFTRLQCGEGRGKQIGTVPCEG